MSTRIQIRRSTAPEWVNVNPVLSDGEIGYEVPEYENADGSVSYEFTGSEPIKPGKFKIGDGVTPWNSLFYFNPPPEFTSQLVNNSGYITIDSVPTKVSELENDRDYVTPTTFPDELSNIISANNILNWNSAYSWGNHNTAGYLQSSIAANTYQLKNVNLDSFVSLSNSPTSQGILRKVLNTSGGYDWILDSSTYLTSADLGNITSSSVTNWNTAYSWGNHAVAGYITSITADNRYQTKDDDLTAIAGISATTGLLRKIAANSWTLDSNTYLTTTGAASTYQAKSDGLTNIAGLTGTSGLLRKTGEDLWALDTTNYLTATSAASTYLTISAAGTTYLTQSGASTTYLTQTNAANTYLTQTSAASTYLTTASAASTYLTQTNAASTYLTQTNAANNYQPLDSDLTTIAGLTTNGLLRRTTGTWGVDTKTYAELVSAPANASSPGTPGQIAYSSNFIYVCIATNTWERVAIASW